MASRTLTNEVGTQITVEAGDVVRMRSGNTYLITSVPTGGASGPADWPTGTGVQRANPTEYADVMLDRIHAVTPGTPASKQLARTAENLGLGSNMPERIVAMIGAVQEAARTAPAASAGAARTAGAPTGAGTGNS